MLSHHICPMCIWQPHLTQNLMACLSYSCEKTLFCNTESRYFKCEVEAVLCLVLQNQVSVWTIGKKDLMQSSDFYSPYCIFFSLLYSSLARFFSKKQSSHCLVLLPSQIPILLSQDIQSCVTNTLGDFHHPWYMDLVTEQLLCSFLTII